MQPALALQAEEAGFFSSVDGMNRFGGVYITDRDVALFPEWVIGQVVILQIAVNVAVRPVGDRMYLPAFALGFQKRHVAAA